MLNLFSVDSSLHLGYELGRWAVVLMIAGILLTAIGVKLHVI
jgi:hypothetical protein